MNFEIGCRYRVYLCMDSGQHLCLILSLSVFSPISSSFWGDRSRDLFFWWRILANLNVCNTQMVLWYGAFTHSFFQNIPSAEENRHSAGYNTTVDSLISSHHWKICNEMSIIFSALSSARWSLKANHIRSSGVTTTYQPSIRSITCSTVTQRWIERSLVFPFAVKSSILDNFAVKICRLDQIL